jgi:hypothetical protein
MRSARVAAVLDICCVLVFVIIGRASHAKGESLGGIASTSWPFLCGLGAGWVASRAWRRPLAVRPAGIAAWLCTVALGMILRVVSGQGTAVAFIVVALAFLGLFLLGWRLAAKLVARGDPKAGRPGHPVEASAEPFLSGAFFLLRTPFFVRLVLCALSYAPCLIRLRARLSDRGRFARSVPHGRLDRSRTGGRQ